MGVKTKKGLSALSVQRVTRAGKYYDNKGHGLYLLVTEKVRKRWGQRITCCSRRREIGLGRYPDVSLKNARQRALRNCLLAFDGIDPIVHKRAQHRRVPTFAEAADGAISDRRKKWTNPQMEQRWRRSIERHVCPSLGHLLVSDIDTQAVAAVLSRLHERFPKSVVRVRQQISVVFAWAAGSGFRTDNPCGPALDAVMQLEPTKSGYHQALPHDQVSDALARVRVADRWVGERLLLEFLVLTAVRTNEARGALWSEIDWGARRWTVPAERMKERTAHDVPLSSAALAVLCEARDHPDLEEVRQRFGERDLVFPTLNGRRLYNNGLANFVKHIALACVPHGFRSSFSTWSAEAGHDFALAEMCLSHAVGSEVSRRYRRTGLFVPRIPIMEEWGCYVAPVRSVAPADSDPTLTPDLRVNLSVTPRMSHVAENARGRDFVVGDVHGCFRTLERALSPPAQGFQRVAQLVPIALCFVARRISDWEHLSFLRFTCRRQAPGLDVRAPPMRLGQGRADRRGWVGRTDLWVCRVCPLTRTLDLCHWAWSKADEVGPDVRRSVPRRAGSVRRCAEAGAAMGRELPRPRPSRLTARTAVRRKVHVAVSVAPYGSLVYGLDPLRTDTWLETDMKGWCCVRYGDALAWVGAPTDVEAVRRSLELHFLGDWTDDARELAVFPQHA